MDIEVADKQSPRPEQTFVVQGTVRYADGSPLPSVIVRAFDKDLRSEEPLGEATTDQSQGGGYEIGYTADQFRRAEKEAADLVILVNLRCKRVNA